MGVEEGCIVYIDIDLEAPLLASYIRNSKVRNTLLNNWPTTTVDGHEVFSKLYIYSRDGEYTTASNAHTRLYKMLGTSDAEINRTDFSEVQNVWLYMKPISFVRPQITALQVASYINSNCEVGEEITVDVTFTRLAQAESLRALPNPTDQELVAMIEGGIDSVYPYTYVRNTITGIETPDKVYQSNTIIFDDKVSPVTFASLFDISDSIFTSNTKIRSREITPTGNRRAQEIGGDILEFALKINATYTFSRTRDVVSTDTLCTLIADKSNTLDILDTPLFLQIRRMLETYYPTAVDDALYYTKSYVDDQGETQEDKYVKVSGVSGLKRSEVVDLLPRVIKHDYQKRDQSSWSKFAEFAVIAAVIIGAFLLAGPPGAGAATSATAAFFGTFTLYMTIAIVGLGIAAKNSGGYNTTSVFSGSSSTISGFSTLVSYFTMFLNVTSLVINTKAGISKATEETARKQGVDLTTASVTETLKVYAYTAMDYVVDSVVSASDSVVSVAQSGSAWTMTSVNNIVTNLNYVFTTYVKLFPIKDPGVPEDSTEVATNTSDIEISHRYVDDGKMYELNEVMDNMPYDMTQGLVDRSYDRYYSNS